VGTIIAPVGGGGLLAGLALATAKAGHVRVVGVEAEQSRAFSSAMAAGHVVQIEIGTTLADGLAGNIEPGSVTVEVARRHQIALLAVPEDEIEAAIRFLATQAGLIVEASAAVALAPVLSGRLPSGPGTTVVVLTGRNIEPAMLAKFLGT
jgi:threonine dehydratase